MRSNAYLALAALGMLVLVPVAHAQEPTITDYKIPLPSVTGQTCLENQDNKEIKCAILDETTSGFVPVAQLEVRSRFSRDMLIQYCAKVEDVDFEGFECEATVDGTVASPGSTKPLEQTSPDPDNPTGVTIYNFCLSWFAEASGRGKHQVEVQCEFKNENPNADGQVRFDSSTTTVYSR